MPKTLYALRLDDDLLAALRALEQRDGAPVSESIRRGITMYLRSKRVAIGGKKKARKIR